MKTLRLAVLALGLLAMGCGGGGDGGGPAGPGGGGGGGGGSNSFSGTIDGTNWKSDAALIQVTGDASAARQGTLSITGYSASAKRGITLTISFFTATTPVTQPLGVNPASNPGGVGSVIVTPTIWSSPLSGKAGFVTLTARTDKRIAGTFNFGADALVGGTVPASRNVTNGKFDITIAGGLPALPTGVGSTSTANIGGTPWNAATIVGLHPGAGVFGITASTTEYTITLTPVVPVSAGQSWNIPSQVTVQVIQTGTANAWAAISGPDIGSINITTFDTHRLVATYSAAGIASTGGGSPLTITSGTVNAYLQ
ncbi:MAG TPA: hypothetical protein VFH33_01020 [Candidatus Krumholzibacteria bacterium]|nr:hypothetical protein [Candidatus Krumholzibacteria bacterium]